jgi:hypothetical protein
MLNSPSKITFCHVELLKRVSYVKDTAGKLAHSLDELLRGLRVLNGFQLNRTASLSVMDDVHTATVATKSFHDQLSVVVDNVKLTDFSILLDCMYLFQYC